MRQSGRVDDRLIESSHPGNFSSSVMYFIAVIMPYKMQVVTRPVHDTLSWALGCIWEYAVNKPLECLHEITEGQGRWLLSTPVGGEAVFCLFINSVPSSRHAALGERCFLTLHVERVCLLGDVKRAGRMHLFLCLEGSSTRRIRKYIWKAAVFPTKNTAWASFRVIFRWRLLGMNQGGEDRKVQVLDDTNFSRHPVTAGSSVEFPQPLHTWS